MPHLPRLDNCRLGPQSRGVLGEPGGLLVGEVGGLHPSRDAAFGDEPAHAAGVGSMSAAV